MQYIPLSKRFKEGTDYYEKETGRLENLYVYENTCYANGAKFIAGIDEAGRGPLAGPVVAGAVILPKDVVIEGLNDSKKVSAKKREELYELIQKNAIAYAVGIVDNNIIDKVNILNATHIAMEIAVQKLKVQPDVLLIDKEVLKDVDIEQVPIVHGDALSVSIAAASIIAKVTRDRMIIEMDEKYPEYGFAKHKGYGTAAHIEAIKKYGLCEIHRRSFTKNFI